MKKADLTKYDANAAGALDANVFGLPFDASESNVILIPVPWEATTSYGRGASQGPRAILEASPQLDLFDIDWATTGLPRPYEFGIHMREDLDEVRAWNDEASRLAEPIIARGGAPADNPVLRKALERVNALSELVNGWVRRHTDDILAAGKIPGLVGGDHSVSFGAIDAVAARHPGVGILHIDAHADLRVAYEGFEYSHASIMENVMRRVGGVARLVQVGIRDFSEAEFELSRDHPRVTTWYDAHLKERLHGGEPWSRICDAIVAELPEQVYVSFDVDGLEPWLCPGTGTPVPGGLDFAQAVTLLKTLHRHGRKVVGFDLNEVAPDALHATNQWNGNVGARVLYKLCGLALVTQGARN